MDMDIDKINNLPFIFIVAKGRSGTSLLQNILDANKHVILPIESKFIIHLKSKYFGKNHWSESLIDEFVNDLYKETKFSSHWNIDKTELTKKIKSYPVKKLNFQTLCKIVYLSYPSPFKRENLMVIGDKNPIYSMFISELREIFPSAKFIHLVRDYRDNVLSNLKTFGYETIPSISKHWVAYNESIENEKKKNPDLFYTLKYEDLVNNPSSIVPKICDFIEVPFYEEMLSFNETLKEKLEDNFEENIINEMNEIQPNIIKPINTNYTEKWRKHFNNKDINIIEYIAGAYGNKYGYKISNTKNLSFSFKLELYKIHGSFRHKYKFLIIKLYYKLPMGIRDFFRYVSYFFYKNFGLTNYFNKADFRNTEKTIK